MDNPETPLSHLLLPFQDTRKKKTEMQHKKYVFDFSQRIPPPIPPSRVHLELDPGARVQGRDIH